MPRNSRILSQAYDREAIPSWLQTDEGHEEHGRPRYEQHASGVRGRMAMNAVPERATVSRVKLNWPEEPSADPTSPSH